jgi:heparosan-N-sulfate-glucuronate 5-epimerase
MSLMVEREITRIDSSSVRRRFNYFQRTSEAYILRRKSQLTFWHDSPEPNPNSRVDVLGEYYMPFLVKADYCVHMDENGIPLLNYRGRTGLQYNPIAIAQYGLGNYNAWARGGDTHRLDKFLLVADWLVTNLGTNEHGLRVWEHLFDWEYRTVLRAPWYSGLAQGQGLSVLLRAHKTTRNPQYLYAAQSVFQTFTVPVEHGGVLYVDDAGCKWFEEYIVHPDQPTHILNGFMWASWGVWDYWLSTQDPSAFRLFRDAVETMKHSLESYDCGFWSLYEHSGTRLPMVASNFYHRLHIAQLRVMFKLTSEPMFQEYADRWERYTTSSWNRGRALAQKALFKVVGY